MRRISEAKRQTIAAIRKRLKAVFFDFRLSGGVAYVAYQRDATSSHGPIREACERAKRIKYAHWPKTADRCFRSGSNLFIYFGSLSDVLPGKFVGHELVTLCRLHGVEVKWNGSSHKTIEIIGLW